MTEGSHQKITQGRTIAGSVLRRALLLAAVWAALVGTDAEAWLFGLFSIPLATALSLQLMPAGRAPSARHLLALMPGFLVKSIAGGADVARRAFDPRLPLKPGWLVRRVALSPGGRVALGAELSLMPGTLVAGSKERELLVHVLDTGTDHERVLDLEEARLAAVMGRDQT